MKTLYNYTMSTPEPGVRIKVQVELGSTLEELCEGYIIKLKAAVKCGLAPEEDLFKFGKNPKKIVITNCHFNKYDCGVKGHQVDVFMAINTGKHVFSVPANLNSDNTGLVYEYSYMQKGDNDGK